MKAKIVLDILDYPAGSTTSAVNLARSEFVLTTTDYDNATYQLEVVYMNSQAATSETLNIRNVTDAANITGPTLAQNISTPTRVVASFTPVTGTKTYRLQIPATASNDQVKIFAARIIVTQTEGMTKTRVMYPLIGNPTDQTSNSNTANVDLTTSATATQGNADKYSIFKLDLGKLANIAGTNPYSLEIVGRGSSLGTVIKAALYNRRTGNKVANSEITGISGTTIATQTANWSTDTEWIDGDTYELRIWRSAGTGNAEVHAARLYIRLNTVTKLQTWYRMNKQFVTGVNFTVDHGRVYVDTSAYNNPVARWVLTGRESSAGTGSIVLINSGTQESGTGSETQLDIFDPSSTTRGLHERSIAITGDNRYYTKSVVSTGEIAFPLTMVEIYNNNALLVSDTRGGKTKGVNEHTDDRCNGGTITASAENGPGEGKEKAFDNDTGSKWLAFASSGWIQYQFPSGNKYCITKYTITSGNDAPERDPKDWTLKGSNDGTNWTTLDTRTNDANWTARNQTRSFYFSNNQHYEYYRLDISAVNGASILQLSEIEMMEAKVLVSDTRGAKTKGIAGTVVSDTRGARSSGKETGISSRNARAKGSINTNIPLFFDEFSSDRLAADYDVVGPAAVSGGILTLGISSPGNWADHIVVTKVRSFTDFEATAKVHYNNINSQIVIRSGTTQGSGYGIQIRDANNFRLEEWGNANLQNVTVANWIDDTIYSVKIRVIGNRIFAKVWVDGESEPSSWHIDYTDTAGGGGGARFTSGGVGVGIEHDAVAASFDDLRVIRLDDRRDARTKGVENPSDNRSAETKGSAITSDVRSARLKGNQLTNETRSGRTIGNGTASNTRGSTTTGNATDTANRGAKARGKLTTSETRNAFTKGVAVSAANRSARSKGYGQDTSVRSAKTTGIQIVSSSRNAFTKGQSVSSNSRSSRAKGLSTASAIANARTKGQVASSDSRSAKSKGVDVIGSVRQAKLLGKAISESVRTAKSKGVASIPSTRGAKTAGQEGTFATRSASTIGNDTTSNNRSSRTKANQNTASTRSALTHGSITEINSRPAASKGKAAISSIQNAKTKGNIKLASQRQARVKGFIESGMYIRKSGSFDGKGGLSTRANTASGRGKLYNRREGGLYNKK